MSYVSRLLADYFGAFILLALCFGFEEIYGILVWRSLAQRA